jgi:hypothetical protein
MSRGMVTVCSGNALGEGWLGCVGFDPGGWPGAGLRCSPWDVECFRPPAGKILCIAWLLDARLLVVCAGACFLVADRCGAAPLCVGARNIRGARVGVALSIRTLVPVANNCRLH